MRDQLPAVLAQQFRALKLWKDSLNAVAGSTADLEEKREFYVSETARRVVTIYHNNLQRKMPLSMLLSNCSKVKLASQISL